MIRPWPIVKKYKNIQRFVAKLSLNTVFTKAHQEILCSGTMSQII
jgi:hypothetical protein